MKVISSQESPRRSMRAVCAGLLILLVASIGGKAAGRNAGPAGTLKAAQGKPVTKELSIKEEEERAAVVEELMDRACRMCHPIENITRMRRTVREWADVLTTMQGRGANATEEEFEAIHWYLNRYVGVVRVNTASVDELAAVLGLKAKEAQAIVDYRKANGDIADLAALMKIEGIDKAKIEEQPDALRFQ